jgi:16S rRNA (guanine966-N2)-methyltransferase
MSNPRVITGSAKGVRLDVPRRGTRPMTDRVKSALFSMINPIIINSNILDLYAGTGALGIECLSRGAKSCVFIDRSKYAIYAIKANLDKTGLTSLAKVFKCSASHFLDEFSTFNCQPSTVNLIFFSPPHADFKEKILVKVIPLLAKDGIVIAEHANTRKVNDRLEDLEKIDEREYGITGLSFFKKR